MHNKSKTVSHLLENPTFFINSSLFLLVIDFDVSIVIPSDFITGQNDVGN